MLFSCSERPLGYRPDIDGLRGIAVLLVLAFHFELPAISGGYIGVDIFFVISGFLIASLLCAGPSWASFYARRMKRLLPMFVFVLFITTLLAALFLLPEDFVAYTRSLYHVLILKANVFFDEVARDYFAPNARSLPLLHTWSLSIEWHFYLSFPFIFVLARKHLSTPWLAALLALLVGAFATLSCIETGSGQQAYYLTSARIHELLLGSLIALLRFDVDARAQRAAVYAALLLLLACAMVFDGHTPFPGANSLIVALATALVLAWGAGNRLLTMPWLVHTGRISYSAYLWHWPLLAILTYLQVALSLPLRLALLGLTLLLAELSYRWIETPGKALAWSFRKLLLWLFIVPALLAIVFFQIVRKNDGFYGRLGAEAAAVHAAIKPYVDNQRLGCLKESGPGGLSECSFGDVQAATTAYLMGDSHAGHFRYFVAELAKEPPLHVLSLVHSNCLMLAGASHLFRSAADDQRCRTAFAEDYARLEAARPRYVLLAQRWQLYPWAEIEKLDATLARLSAWGITPVLFGGLAENGKDIKDCFYRHIKLRGSYQGNCDIAEDNAYAAGRQAQLQQLFAAMQKKYPGLILIEPRRVQCQQGVCAGQIDGVPIYDDAHHLNGYGATLLARRYLQRFGNPLAVPEG